MISTKSNPLAYILRFRVHVQTMINSFEFTQQQRAQIIKFNLISDCRHLAGNAAKILISSGHVFDYLKAEMYPTHRMNCQYPCTLRKAMQQHSSFPHCWTGLTLMPVVLFHAITPNEAWLHFASIGNKVPYSFIRFVAKFYLIPVISHSYRCTRALQEQAPLNKTKTTL